MEADTVEVMETLMEEAAMEVVTGATLAMDPAEEATAQVMERVTGQAMEQAMERVTGQATELATEQDMERVQGQAMELAMGMTILVFSSIIIFLFIHFLFVRYNNMGYGNTYGYNTGYGGYNNNNLGK